MDVELTATAMPPNEQFDTTPETAASKLIPSSQTSATSDLLAALSPHHVYAACRIYQPKMTLRRRCRSECLQTAPIMNTSLDSYLDHLNELRVKLNFENGVSDIHITDGSIHALNDDHVVNSNKMFSIIDSFRTSNLHDENIKENISTDSILNELKNTHVDDSELLDDLKVSSDFGCENLAHLYTDQALLDNQKLLLKINEEIDKKYFDILNSARTGVEKTHINDDNKTVANGLGSKGKTEKNRRRARSKSESEPHDILQSKLSSPLAVYRLGGDDLLLKRAREDKSTKLVGTRDKNCSPSKINGHHLRFTTNHLGNLIRSRPCTPHRFIKSLTTLKKQKAALLRAKTVKRATSTSPSATPLQHLAASSEPMVVSIPVECATIAPTTVPQPVAPEKLNEEKKKNEEDSETEYSSLEDDDDYAGGVDDGEDSITDSEDNFPINDQTNTVNNLVNSSVDLSTLPAVTMLADCVQGQPCGQGPLTPSLFSHVPPYITFATHEEKGPLMPATVTKILKWKLTTITPVVIRKILFNSGFRLLKKTNDYMGVWGKHMKSPCFKTVRSYQKINHIPGSFQIGRKDRIWRNLQTQMSRHGRKEFNFMPHTYIIPQDLKQLRRVWPKYNQKNTKWIIKPPASARGTGIKVINRWTQIPKRKPMIVQKYVDRPLLINGSKFDLRLYVLVTSINPLRAYMHTDGLARFASVKYSDKSDTLSDRYMHLTNYSINKLSANYTKNEDATACQGHKWTVKTLWTYLAEQGVNVDRLWAALRNLVLRTIFSGEHAIHQMSKVNVGSKYNCFELFGIDVILDSELKPWLLEVNISPSLHSSSPLDLFVKGPLATALLNTALFQVPPRLNQSTQEEILNQQGLNSSSLCFDKRLYVTNLTKAEKIKHNHFSQKSMTNREDYLEPILENLTPDDIRCLITTEDELDRCAPLERIFPTPTSHRYLHFSENPRYYNRLLDAWETKYGRKRHERIELLRKYCMNKVHLSVPPQPVKKASENNSNECKHTEDENDGDADDDDEEEDTAQEDNNKASPLSKTSTQTSIENDSITNCTVEIQSVTKSASDNQSNTAAGKYPPTHATCITNGFNSSNCNSSHIAINNHFGSTPILSPPRKEHLKYDTPLPLSIHSENTLMQNDSDSELLKSPSSKLFLLNGGEQLNDIENSS